MTTRAGRAFTTLHDKIRRLEEINAELLEACKFTYSIISTTKQYFEPEYQEAIRKLRQAISKVEGKRIP